MIWIMMNNAHIRWLWSDNVSMMMSFGMANELLVLSNYTKHIIRIFLFIWNLSFSQALTDALSVSYVSPIEWMLIKFFKGFSPFSTKQMVNLLLCVWLKHLPDSLMHKTHQFILALQKHHTNPYNQITYHYVCVLCEWEKGIKAWKA